MRKWFWIVSIFVFFLTHFMAPSSAAVTGTVTDTEGNPLAGATVTFTDESNPNNQFSNMTDAQGHYKVELVITGVQEIKPDVFSLGDNYPNPFNPTTTIPFTLNTASYVSLSIYNVMGQHITTLVDTEMNIGSHVVTWDGHDEQGSHVSAGVYLYQLKTGNYAETNKMLLLDGGGGSLHSASVVVEPAINSHTTAKITAETTYRITITHPDIMQYHKTGISVSDGQAINFTVSHIGAQVIIGGMALMSIPSGSFRMGDISDSGDSNEYPVHDVTISSFEMGIYEVTQEQYESVMGSKPLSFSGTSLPVEKVSWSSAVRFCNALSEQSGLAQCYDEDTWECNFSANGFRLPTEAEWEYVCRAGTETKYYTGNSESDLGRAGWYSGNSGKKTHAIGVKEPSVLGLYDMHGNVWEWCNDWYDLDYYSLSPSADPTGPPSGSYRVYRGGGWSNGTFNCRSADRAATGPANSFNYLGFRVVRRP